MPQGCVQDSSDAVLIDRAIAGESQAFEQLVLRYEYVLRQSVRFFLKSDESEDVLQFVWIQLYRSLPQLQLRRKNVQEPYGASLKAWLLSVARNRCLDELRRHHTSRLFSFSELEASDREEGDFDLTLLVDPSPLPEEIVEQHEVRESLVAAIESLPLRSRTVIWLRYGKGLSFREIGQHLHIPIATAKTYDHRGRMKLRASMAPLRSKE